MAFPSYRLENIVKNGEGYQDLLKQQNQLNGEGVPVYDSDRLLKDW
jgi:hypothetical protein